MRQQDKRERKRKNKVKVRQKEKESQKASLEFAAIFPKNSADCYSN